MENQAAITFKREELFRLVWKEPATKIAEQCQTPYPDFKKICDSMEIPLPGSGYRSKLRAGKPVPDAVLPGNYSGPMEVIIEPKVKIVNINKLLPNSQDKPELESEFNVPVRLTNPDPLILAAKAQLENKNAYLHDGLVYAGSGNISIKVSPTSVLRALRFMDTFIKILKARGYGIKVNYHDTTVSIDQEEFRVRLREKLNRTMVKGTHWDNAVYKPDGILIFVLDDYPKREWKDGRRMLEDFMPEIVSSLEEKAKAKKEWRIKSEIAAAERREKERIEWEQVQLQEKELERFKGLLQDAQRWRQVKLLREYIADMKNIAPANGNLPVEQADWIEWASKKADWYDPQVNFPDKLMNNVDKDTLTVKKKTPYYGW